MDIVLVGFSLFEVLMNWVCVICLILVSNVGLCDFAILEYWCVMLSSRLCVCMCVCVISRVLWRIGERNSCSVKWYLVRRK